MKWVLFVLPLFFSGCMDITMSLQPENLNVPASHTANDCVPIIFGFAYGRASIEGALIQPASLSNDFQTTVSAITKIRRVQLHETQILFVGNRCVEVVGE